MSLFTELFQPGYDARDGFRTSDWSFIEIPGAGVQTRVYYLPQDTVVGTGFHFCAVEVDSHRHDPMRELDDLAWIWKDADTEVDIVCYGTALFDGVRHMYFGDEGYVHYPNFGVLKRMLTVLQQLQKQFCNDPALQDME